VTVARLINGQFFAGTGKKAGRKYFDNTKIMRDKMQLAVAILFAALKTR